MGRLCRRLAVVLGLLAAAGCGVRDVRAAVMPADTAGVAPGHPRDYMAEARAAFTPENRAYQRQRIALALLAPLYAILAGFGMLATGLAQRFRDIALARARGRYLQILIFFSLYSLVMFVVLLPLDWYAGFALEHRFGLSSQTWGDWSADEVKALLFQVFVVAVLPVLALAWRAVEASPKRWWLWLACGSAPVAVVAVLFTPLVYDPLFNHFTRLQDPHLRGRLLALAARAGVPARDVYEVDMSRKTHKVNAYMTGFGASQRIVLWDTTLQRLREDEIVDVMGHEMGHYVLGHIWKGTLLGVLGAFLAFRIVAWLMDAVLGTFGPRWGVRAVADLAAIPLLVALFSLVSYVSAPVSNAVSREIEHEADVFSLELTHDNDASARSFLALAEDNKSDPEPPRWVKLALYSHPPLGDRIRFALDYHPWTEGRPNRFYHPR